MRDFTIESREKICVECGEERPIYNFIKKTHTDSIDTCCECIKKYEGNLFILIGFLKRNNVPFIQKEWDSRKGEDFLIEKYLWNITNNKEYEGLKWEDSIFGKEMQQENLDGVLSTIKDIKRIKRQYDKRNLIINIATYFLENECKLEDIAILYNKSISTIHRYLMEINKYWSLEEVQKVKTKLQKNMQYGSIKGMKLIQSKRSTQ